MRDQKKADEIATKRVQLLLPLLDQGLDTARAKQIKAGICAQNGISERTLRRYLAQYQAEGFNGLKPKSKQQHSSEETIPPALLEQAILLRRQVPGRSIAQIIKILEWEGLAQPGQIKRSTLQGKLAEQGYSARQMRMYAETGVAARRFQKRYRNQLVHSDIKYGPYLPIGKDGAMKQVYLVTFIDDATRYVLHGQFYNNLEQGIVQDCFRQVIQKYGAPRALYFDNGRQYRTKWMARACAKLGVRLLYTKPFSPEAHGKSERLNRVVDSFLAEAALEKPSTLDKLNQLFRVWLEECYNNRPHSGLADGLSPAVAYRSDKQPLRFLPSETVADAFLNCEERKVDKSGCISFAGKKYEAGLLFIGCTVNVIYDPADITELTIEYEGHSPWKAKQLIIGERSGQRPPLPEHLLTKPAESSRLLNAASKQNQLRKEQTAPAITYRKEEKEVADRV